MTRFFTLRKQVILKAGQVVKFLKGAGYYAARPKDPVPPKPSPSQRTHFVEVLRWMVANKGLFRYAEIRPIPVFLTPFSTRRTITTDCSGSVTLAAKWAGCPDPNGRNFDGQGYTGTILSHCRHISRDAVRPGDLIVYGSGTGHHVVAVLSKMTYGDFEIFSHGRPGDPEVTTHSAMTANQAGFGATAITYCAFLA